jgi:hypothetical protein
MTRQRSQRDRPDRDWCAGENDTCAREFDPSLPGVPGKDGLCRKHHVIKATPARRR